MAASSRCVADQQGRVEQLWRKEREKEKAQQEPEKGERDQGRLETRCEDWEHDWER